MVAGSHRQLSLLVFVRSVLVCSRLRTRPNGQLRCEPSGQVRPYSCTPNTRGIQTKLLNVSRRRAQQYVRGWAEEDHECRRETHCNTHQTFAADCGELVPG